MKKIGLAVLAALGAFAAFSITAAPAQADICGDLWDECDIADNVLSWNLDQFEDFWPLDADTCAKMGDGVLKQCETAVKDAAKCWKKQISSIPKTAKSACKTEGDLAGECNADYKGDASDDLEELDYYEGAELECCVTAAVDFYANCVIHP